MGTPQSHGSLRPWWLPKPETAPTSSSEVEGQAQGIKTLGPCILSGNPCPSLEPTKGPYNKRGHRPGQTWWQWSATLNRHDCTPQDKQQPALRGLRLLQDTRDPAQLLRLPAVPPAALLPLGQTGECLRGKMRRLWPQRRLLRARKLSGVLD